MSEMSEDPGGIIVGILGAILCIMAIASCLNVSCLGCVQVFFAPHKLTNPDKPKIEKVFDLKQEQPK
jgi:hypothetical protein